MTNLRSLIEIFFLLVFWTFVLTVALLLLKALPRSSRYRSRDLSENIKSDGEAVAFSATDGLPLHGYIFTGRPEAPWVVLCHGFNGSSIRLFPLARHLAGKNGFNVLAFDFRAHGRSRGKFSSFGLRERRDLEAALAFVSARQEARYPLKPVGVYGVSMGASVAAMVCADDDRIAALVLDSPYLRLDRLLGRYMRLLYRLPKYPFLNFLCTGYALLFRCRPSDVAPGEAAAIAQANAALVLVGTRDDKTPLQDVWNLFGRLSVPTKRWVEMETGHLEALQEEEPGYHERIGTFFASHLNLT